MTDTATTGELEGVRQYRFSLPPGATDLLLVRHGESEPAHPERPFPTVDGHADPPLDPRGHLEAERVADRLVGADITAIYVSTLRRTQETAAPLAARLGIDPVVDPDLREIHLGEWEGGVFPLRMRQWGPMAQRIFSEERWDIIPGAESTASLQARLRAAVSRISAAHPDGRVVVVAHGGVIGTILSLATGSRPFAFVGADNGSVSHLVVTPETWILRRFNDTGHLDTDLDAPPQPLT
jgi:2,3-bisphosphoglycerate-dependent phosphoglycerate mutase